MRFHEVGAHRFDVSVVNVEIMEILQASSGVSDLEGAISSISLHKGGFTHQIETDLVRGTMQTNIVVNVA